MRTRSAVWAVLLIIGLMLVISGITGTLPDLLGCILVPAQMETAAAADASNAAAAPGAVIRNAVPSGINVPGTGLTGGV